MKTRKHITDKMRQQIAEFYGGRSCVVSGNVDGTLHHIDGDPSHSVFENLLPVQHELHARLPPPPGARSGSILSAADGELDPQHLREIARRHYRRGKTAPAFGCARLAHGVRRYYRRREPDDELRSLLDALYYLRRYLVVNARQGYRLLEYLLSNEIIPTLKGKPLLSATVSLMMLEEMGTWLNEFGACKSAMPILRIARERVRARTGLAISTVYRSGMFRQWAFSLIYCGEQEKVVDHALRQAEDCDDSNQNRIGIVNAQTSLLLACGEGTRARDAVLPVVYETSKAAGDLRYARPERIGCSYENYLALLSGGLLSRVQTDAVRSPDSVSDDLRQYQAAESRLDARARFVWTPRFYRQFQRVGASVHDFPAFLRDHTAPPLPPKLIQQCERAVELIVSG